jgi:hypothetical protein
VNPNGHQNSGKSRREKGWSDNGAKQMGPGMTAERLLPVALGWIQFRAQNAGYPASVQIRTGFHILYPCHRNTVPVRERVDPDKVIDRTTKVLELMKAAKMAMAFLH